MVMRSKFKGHGAHFICNNSWGCIIIKTDGRITTGQTQDMYMYLYCRANELVGFWGLEVKDQRCTHVCEK